jgi:hypothetical protein
MSGFLTNMIQRHQGAVDTVQPRIRSMFESESPQLVNSGDFAGSTNPVVKNNLDSKDNREFGIAALSIPVNESSENTSGTPPSSRIQPSSDIDLSITADGRNSLDNERLNSMHVQIQDVLARLNRKSDSTEPSHDNVPLQFEIPHDIHAHSANIVTSPETGSSNNIEEILSRIQSEINRIAQSKQSPETDRLAFAAAKPREIDPQPATQAIRQESKIADPFERADKPFKQPDRIEPASADRQTGSLLIPEWLAVLQAELNNRWHENSARPNPERVVNVTIGRIEIRATHPTPKQQSNVTEKPKGVLSLDDYLKLRESKGRP